MRTSLVGNGTKILQGLSDSASRSRNLNTPHESINLGSSGLECSPIAGDSLSPVSKHCHRPIQSMDEQTQLRDVDV